MRPSCVISLLILAAGSATFAGCASSFVVKSDPTQAEVFVEDPRSGVRKSLGKTPIEMKTALLKETVGENVLSGEFFTVSVEKKDFQTLKFSIPATRFGTLVTQLDAKLKAGPDPAKEERLASDILNRLFLAQKMALSQQYERAQAELDKLLGEFPDFPRALSMRASIYYMQKNFIESLKWYELALKADPQMEEAVKMSAKVRDIQAGVRKPAGKPKAP